VAARKLIVNADDFGLSEKVNEGIVQAHRNGVVTSASIIANGVAFEHAVELCHSTPTLDVGVHLTLVEEKPLSDKRDIPSLVDKSGCFYHHAMAFIQRYLLSHISFDEVRYELDLQVRKVLASGIEVSHLDSHQHIHILPRISRIVGKLAKKYNIPAVRYPRERLKSYMFKQKDSCSKILKLLVLNTFCAFSDVRGAKHPDHFVGVFFAGRLNKKNLQRVIENLPIDGICELVCHPGLHDPEGKYQHWHYHWQEEHDALTDREIKDLLGRNGINLMSYRELANSYGM
jgi:hopanoid biosynthesis associated protein HpnK